MYDRESLKDILLKYGYKVPDAVGMDMLQFALFIQIAEKLDKIYTTFGDNNE